MNREQVDRVRSFNRALTRRIGALDESFLDSGRPLSEARVIYEIGREGVDVRELRLRLSLDSGHMSRLLRSLERQGLVETRPADDDGRVRRAVLTRKGTAEFDSLDGRSDAFAASLLAPLTDAERARLIAAMEDIEKLLRESAIEITVQDPRSTEARWCILEYFRELNERFSSGFDAAKSISATPDELTPPSGYFLLVRLEGRPIGCGALKVKDGRVGEIKRMWVARSERGHGIGRRILEALEDQARHAGLTTLRLESNETCKEAHALYRKSGYREVAPFNDEPYAHHWFEKSGLK